MGVNQSAVCCIKESLAPAQEIIINMNDVALVRRGWLPIALLAGGIAVAGNGKFYEILAAKPGKQVVEDPF